jgi:type VI secretion system protein ImpK
MTMIDYQMDDDKTVFMQVPSVRNDTGKKPSASELAMAVKQASPAPAGQTLLDKMARIDHLSGPNALLENATEVLVLHYQLVNHIFDHSLTGLRSTLNEALVKFELRCQQQGMLKPLVKSAKYILCAFIDETILTSEATKEGGWSRHSLLSHFFNETWGGETFFKIRQFCIENLNDYIQLLEMVYVCICLGFRGKYAAQQEGDLQLERIQRETYQVIREYRGDIENLPLSPSWQSDYTGKKTLRQYQSIWIALGLSLAVLVVTYAGLSYFLSKSSAPIAAKVVAYMNSQSATS